MATFEVTVKGAVYEVEAPNENTAWQWANQTHTSQPSPQKESFDPTEGMSKTQLALAGVGKTFVDAGRGIGQLFGLVSDEDVKESRKLDEALMNTWAGFAGNMAGNIGMALAPGGALKGLGTAANSVSSLAKHAPKLSQIGGSLLAPKNMTQALAVGAGTGLIQPSTSTEETVSNMALGAGAGALIPALGKLYSGGKSLLEPLSDAGQDKIVGRTLRNMAGNQADEVAMALKQHQPLIPGSNPTAAEIANNPGIASLQRTTVSIDPVLSGEMNLRQQANNMARANALDNLAPDMESSRLLREATTQPLYESAKNLPVEMTEGLKALMDRPSMRNALKRAEQLAIENGDYFDVSNLTGAGAQYIKMALDDISNAGIGSGIGAHELRAVKATRAAYLKELETQLPNYMQANQEYARLSRPITQAKMAEALVAKGKDSSGNLTPSSFSRALNDKTARSVTGRVNATLDDIFEPEQMATLNAIKQDLLNRQAADKVGKAVGSNTIQNLAYSNILDQTNLPAALRNIPLVRALGNFGKRGMGLVYGDSDKEITHKLAQALLSPHEAGALMENASESEKRKMLADLLSRGGSGIGVASPYLLNPSQ